MINIGIVGVGNCASSLVQGIEFYKSVDGFHESLGLINTVVGGYLPKDIRVVCGFDVDTEKIGRDMSVAIFLGENNTLRLVDDMPFLNAKVYEAPVLDGLGTTYKKAIKYNENGKLDDPVEILKNLKVDVLLNYLPVGSDSATQYWASVAIKAGCAFVNNIPSFIASDPEWVARFEKAGLPVLGDDIKSQVGATVVHRTLVQLLKERGFSVDRTFQLNYGGNMDFKNMLDTERLESKKQSKTNAVIANLSEGDAALRPGNTHIGPSDFVPFLTDEKWADILLIGRGFGGAPYEIRLNMKVWDSPNSAGVVMDVIRWAKIALDRNISGSFPIPCAYYFKTPPEQIHEDEVLSVIKKEFQWEKI